jgi:predicted MFS family arabinose efflux permease
MRSPRHHLITAAIGTTQTLAWASSYYLPAVLADSITHELDIATSTFFAAFSTSLVVSAVIGPKIGRTIDRLGGRGVLLLSNMFIASGLVALAVTNGISMLWFAWLLLGVGMGLGLYDAAFATLGRVFGLQARFAITIVTLIAGFASTVGWPLTAWGAMTIGWRETCLAWAAAHILIGMPINSLLPSLSVESSQTTTVQHPKIAWDRKMLLVAFAMASAWMVTAAMAAHLPRLLQTAGATPAGAVTAAVLIGPAQVAARLIEAGALSRYHPLVGARLAALAHPLAAMLLGAVGPSASIAFAVLHGAGNGILTIARGTVPLALFGHKNYGYRLGLLGAPARIAQATAPLLFGILVEAVGASALFVSAGLSVGALVALLILQE